MGWMQPERESYTDLRAMTTVKRVSRLLIERSYLAKILHRDFGWEIALAAHAEVAADEGFEIAV